MPALMFVLIWIFTPTVFWPMIRELYGVGRGRVVESDAQVLRFSWCAGEPQQLGVRYGREYARTTGRRDGLGAGGWEFLGDPAPDDEKKCLSRIKTLGRCLQKLYSMLITSNVAGEAANSWRKIR